MSITFGILTVSDTCSKAKEQDKSGPLLKNLVSDVTCETGKILKGNVICSEIVPDEQSIIGATLIRWCEDVGVNVILTTGGTGFSERDVTPEITKNVIEKEAPGIVHAMISASLKITPMAMLSRAVCGIRDKTLIINLPGSPKAARECLSAIANVIPHAVDLILGVEKNIKVMHSVQQNNQHACPCKSTKITSNLNDIANRYRKSPYPMISLEKAQEILKNTVEPSADFAKVSIWESFGKVLAESVYSPCNLPPFRASIKDGYAVIASDGKGERKVLGSVGAGDEPGRKIEPGTCVRINTGAAVPDEATAVVQVEDTILLEKDVDGKEEKKIEILTEPEENQDIRPIGSDILKGKKILEYNTRIDAINAGILAACGVDQVVVRAAPRIGVLSTGNELQQPGEPPKPGHVYDSNKITLLLMLKERGYVAEDLGIAGDRFETMVAAIENAMCKNDVIITTGSVSMGDKDMLKPILSDVFGATIHFGRVNLKPGKPTTYATCDYKGDKKYFLCLPGNPVSAVVTAHLFVFPLLNIMIGNDEKPVVVKAKLAMEYDLDSRPEFARAILEWDENEIYPKAWITGNQISSRLLSYLNANALLMLPGKTNEVSKLEEGDVVSAMLLGCNQKA